MLAKRLSWMGWVGVALLGACSSTGMISSLDDLTAHVDPQGLTSLQQQRLLSLNGLIPNAPPGSMYRYTNTRAPFTAIGISGRKKEGGGPTESFYLEQEIHTDMTEARLVELRNQLVKVRFKAADLIRARLDRVIVSAQEDGAEKNAEISRLKTAIQTKQTSFQTDWEKAVRLLDKSGVMVIRTSTATSTNILTKLGDFFGLAASTNEQSSGFAVLAGLRTSFLFVGKDIDDWSEPAGTDWNLIGKKFPFVLGVYWCGDWPIPILGQLSREDVHIVTAKLEAKHVLYGQDRVTESSYKADLKTSIDELKKLKKTISAIEEVSINAVLSAVESLGNAGYLKAPTCQRIVPFSEWWWAQKGGDGLAATGSVHDQPNHVCSAVPREGPPSRPWQTVYEVLSDFDDTHTFARGDLRLHFSSFL